MRGTTRAARRRSRGDNSDELDFVASANSSLCITRKLLPEASGEHRHKSKAQATTSRTKDPPSVIDTQSEAQEKGCSWRLERLPADAYRRVIKLETMKLRGVVQEGEGDASFWLSKYSDVYRLWTGMTLFPGSLNVRLAEKFDWDDESVEPFKRIYSLVPYGGNRDICLIPCEVYKDEAGKIYGFAWATTHAADDFDYRVLEIITSVRLREVLRLTDGSALTIDIPVSWRC